MENGMWDRHSFVLLNFGREAHRKAVYSKAQTSISDSSSRGP